jgi:broad specificity phosphatase PhoE
VIYLVRHGETDANAARVVQTPDVPLSARGRVQAQALGRRLADAGVARIVSSDLRRAVETAEIVARATGAALRFDAGLEERNFGDVRGTAYAELAEDLFGPDFAPPGGETWADFHARVDAAWARVLAHADEVGGDLAVVTHGLVCRAVVQRHCDVDGACEIPLAWGNTAVTILEPPRGVRLLGCTAHLGDVAPDGGAV